MKKIINILTKVAFNPEYRKLLEQQKIAKALFNGTTGNDRTSIYARELAKKSYDSVTEQINKMKKEANIKKIAQGKKRKLIA